MKIASLILVLVSSFATLAQTKNLSDFSQLKVSGRMEVEVHQSDSNYIAILDKDDRFDLDKLELEYKGDQLAIKYLGSTVVDFDIELAVYVKTLKGISAHQGAEIEVSEKFVVAGEKLTLEAFAGGTIEVKSTAKWIEANIKQGGSISLTGSTDHLDLTITTGGYIAASFLKAKKVKAEIKFGGEIICNATEFLDAKIVSGGEINYKGNPEVNKTIKLGGKVSQI